MSTRSRRSHRVVALVIGVLVGGGLVSANLAFATSHMQSLSGSDFQIDTDANLKVEADEPQSEDWRSVPQGTTPGTEIRQQDSPSGTQDESFGQGTKEDTAVPTVVSGSIPPNKSDLKWFGVYQEGTSSSGFLNLFWSRVQDPQGTTNMDFEFNKNKCVKVNGVATADSRCSANGVTPVRSAGDLLVMYDLSNGGTVPTMWLRTWSGSAWGTPVDLTASNKATGSINTSAIGRTDAESYGLGAHSVRTFGEAQIKLSEVLGAGCTTFGSAYLKSRSSDSFTAAVKDFVPPQAVNVTNCGSVRIVKTGGGTAPLNGAEFTLYNDAAPMGTARNSGGITDPVTNPVLKCVTAGSGADAGTCTIPNVPFGDYWLVETVVPGGYEQAPDQAVSVVSSTLVTKTVDNPVAVIPTTMTTQQRWLPNHQATISVSSGQGNLAGSVEFKLYENSTCTGPAVYTVSRNVSSDDLDGTAGGLTSTVRTGNTAVYTESKAVSWTVEFTSTNIHHHNMLNDCDKSSWALGNNFSG